MSKFALWWVKWDENLGTYESRMTVGGRKIHQNVPLTHSSQIGLTTFGTNLEVIDAVKRRCPGW